MNAKIFTGVIVLLLFAFVGPVIFGSAKPIGRRFTADVETPDGLKTGSTVVSFQESTAPWWFPTGSGRGTTLTRGEAVVVDLGTGRYMFVAMGNVEGIRRIANVSRPAFHDLRDVRRLNKQGDILDRFHPLLLSFANIDDAKSGFEIDPVNLTAAFGPGYRLVRIHVEATDEKPSFGAMDKFAVMMHGLGESDRLAFSSARPEKRVNSW